MLPRLSRLLVLALCLCLCLHVATARNAPRGLIRRQDGEQPAEPAPERTPAPEGEGEGSDGGNGNGDGSGDGEGDAQTTGEKGDKPTATNDEKKATETKSKATAVPTLLDGQDSNTVFNFTVPEGELPIKPRLTPGFGVGGTLLLISGMVYALVGIKNAWLHTFFSTAFLCALATCVLIVYVMPVPVSDPIQGAYVVAIAMTGIVLGIGATIFKEITEGLGCLFGGFCLGMWLLILVPGGLLPQAAPKVILISVLSLVSFGLYFSHYTRDYGLMILISFGGATVTVLGIDCFSRAGLKEFWAYIWDLNEDLFPLGTVTYPVTKGIRVETAAIVIICLVGVVSQMKLWKVIQEKRARKDAEKAEEERNLQVEEEAVGRQIEQSNARDRRAWERVYGDGGGGEEGAVDDAHTHVGSGDSGVGDMESEKRMRHASGGASAKRQSHDGVIIEMNEIALSPPPPSVPPKSPVPAGLVTAASAADEANGKEGGGATVMVRVARDDYPDAPASPSSAVLRDPEERAWAMGDNANNHLAVSRSASRLSRPLSSASRGLAASPPPPEIVPLPFQVTEEEDRTERGTVGDRSSVAGTFADEDDGASKRNSIARRLSQGSMNLLRSLSQRSKGGRDLAGVRDRGGHRHESSEDLVTPRAMSRASRRDDTESLAVTVDMESLHGDHDDDDDDDDKEKTPRGSKGKFLELKLFDGDDDKKNRPVSVANTVGTEILAAFENGELRGNGSEAGRARSEASAEGTPLPAKSTVSKASRRSLTRDSLPHALSRTALKYRTNEWVKHSSIADTPTPDPIHIAAAYSVDEEEEEEEDEARTRRWREKKEAAAPVIVDQLQQTAETGAPAPAPPSRSNTAMSGYDRSMSRSDSRLSVVAGARLLDGQQGRDSPGGVPSPTSGQNSRSASRRSASAQHGLQQPIYEEDIDGLNPSGGGLSPDDSAPTSKAPSPTPPPGVVSYNSPQTLIGQRDIFLRNKMQGTLPPYGGGGVDYSLPLNPTPSDAGTATPTSSYPGYGYQPAPLSPGDDIPLSQRKILIRQNSLLASTPSLSRPTSGLAYHQQQYPQQQYHQSSDNLPFDSHQPSRKLSGPTAAARQAQLANFRNSVQAELRAGTPVVPGGGGTDGRETPFMHFSNSTSNLLPGQLGPGVSGLGLGRESEVQRSIDHQRSVLISQKEAEAQAREAERWEKERNDKAFEQRMRSGPGLLEAHREAMRRLQGGAKKD